MDHHPNSAITKQLTIEPLDNDRLKRLLGQGNENLQQLEKRLEVEISNRSNLFQIVGNENDVDCTIEALQTLYDDATEDDLISPTHVHLVLQNIKGARAAPKKAASHNPTPDKIALKKSQIKLRTAAQKEYVEQILNHDINFGVGPAGTGKTFLAVACACMALEQEKIDRIILVRPAVEAGEKLGFLPGDLAQKVDPYLKPLYDGLNELLGPERVVKLVEKNMIEIAPLAYMRGRTLNRSFIILDESQNTTIEQMKMFLTRIGYGSTAVITGDITQVDLPREKLSGLKHAIQVLKDVPGISFSFFKASDTVRHPLIQSIVEAYENFESSHPTKSIRD